MQEVHDKFSGVSKGYQKYRPDYPQDLYNYILDFVPGRSNAWDAGTGNGQVAIALSERFSRVIATDISANQINEGPSVPNIEYAVCRAEQTNIESHTIDLITVAQAIHWFDIDGFSAEVSRVAKLDSVLAIWGYELLKVIPEVDEVVMKLYNGILNGYWSPHRKLIETQYSTLDFPFRHLKDHRFTMHRSMDVEGLFGYLRTWSAVSKYRQECSKDPVLDIEDELRRAFGPGIRDTYTPVFLRMWLIA